MPISTTHTIGGKGVAKAPMASETPAIAKARASRFLENLIVSEDGLLTPVGCSLGSSGSVIRVSSIVPGISLLLETAAVVQIVTGLLQALHPSVRKIK